MASIRKRGESYLIVVSMGYDYNGKQIKPKQKTVHPPADLTPKQREKWLQEQAVLFERACRNDDVDSRSPDITLAKYIELWLEKVAPNRLAKSTVRRDRQDIARILPSLGHYRLRELRPEHFRSFYAQLRKTVSQETKKPLSENTVEGVHATCVPFSRTPWRAVFCITTRPGGPIATLEENGKSKLRTVKLFRRLSRRWRMRVSNMRYTSN